ncbi:MAG: C_GCAxxG_C_C family protein [Lentisphaeria bacterium]|nr:C_GCAxxG_C_C family protein [Lentisphaeria bacterium]
MDRAKQARENFLNGANCAQAVLAAFADEAGIDRDTALKIGSGLGGGMGRLREVCGAFSAAVIVAGLMRGPPSIRFEDPTLSIVATFFNALNFSGAILPNNFQEPLNSSISEIIESI